jgi:hypothetical protein
LGLSSQHFFQETPIMFAARDLRPLQTLRAQARPGALGAGAGRWCEASRHATAAVLLPRGRPGAWLLLLTGACTWVVVQTVLLRLA